MEYQELKLNFNDHLVYKFEHKQLPNDKKMQVFELGKVTHMTLGSSGKEYEGPREMGRPFGRSQR